MTNNTYIQMPSDGSGKKLHAINQTIDGNSVYQEVSHDARDLLTRAVENNDQGQQIYVGEALPGSSKADAVWRIKKLTWDGSGLTDEQWAEGTTEFAYVWNDRDSYSYS